MRFVWWLVGLGVLAGGAYLYRPIADFGVETWLTFGITAATWSTKALAAHDHLWKSYQNDLAHYYRYLYNIIRFINESDVNKLRYIRILRAQLSDFELLVLFYNGLFPLAAKFKEYVEFFTLFDNLPKDLLFDRLHVEFYDPVHLMRGRRSSLSPSRMLQRRTGCRMSRSEPLGTPVNIACSVPGT